MIEGTDEELARTSASQAGFVVTTASTTIPLACHPEAIPVEESSSSSRPTVAGQAGMLPLPKMLNSPTWIKSLRWMPNSTNLALAELEDGDTNHNNTNNDDDEKFQSEHLGDSRRYWRDIILGVNDGLVSTFLLVAGVTGANMPSKDILLTAIAGMIAGAISMAAGEYIATKTQEEVFQGEAGIERKHITRHRDQELIELRGCFKNIGIVSNNEEDKEEVEDLSRRLVAFYATHDNAHLLAHLVLEFGILEAEKRNPMTACCVSFVLFVCGALPSVVPYAFIDDITVAFIVAGVVTMASLFTVGAIKTWATRGNLWNAAIENLTVSAGGGAVAYGIGYGFDQLVRGK